MAYQYDSENSISLRGTQIVTNGDLMAGLNADKLDDKDSTSFMNLGPSFGIDQNGKTITLGSDVTLKFGNLVFQTIAGGGGSSGDVLIIRTADTGETITAYLATEEQINEIINNG